MKPYTFLSLADFHTLSLHGIVHPDGVPLPGGGSYHPSVTQRWLWHCLTEYEKMAKQAARGRSVFLCLDGDLTHGCPHDTLETVTPDMEVQCAAVNTLLEPFIEMADYVIFMAGTEAHEGKNGQNAEAIAKHWEGRGAQLVVPSTPGRYSHQERDFRCGGVLINAAHHGPGGEPSAAAKRLALQIKAEYDDEHREVPQLIIRAHRHKYGDSYNNVKRTRCIYLPAFTARDNYAVRIAARPADVGGLIMQCAGGRIESIEVPTWTPPKPAPWEPKDDEEKRKTRARKR